MHFGEHLTIDGYGGSFEKLNDKKIILDFLEGLVHRLEMKKLAEPEIYFAPDNHIKDPGGWSAFVVIAESHISIHTFPAKKFLSADVYTCRNGLDTKLVSNLFKETFDLQETEENFVIRGKNYSLIK